jgi:uncharacterized membrane protein
MGATNDRYHRLHSREGGTALERMVFFSDAVFAIAMTLLVIDIRMPEGVNSADMAAKLVEMLPAIGAYAISFYVIAANWVAHHRKFTAIVAIDSTMIWINLVLLFLIAFVPFPTSLLQGYKGDTPLVAVLLYDGVMTLVGVAQYLLWVYAWRHDFVDRRKIDDRLYRLINVNLLVTPVIFLLSMPVALIRPSWGMYFWLLLIPANILVGRGIYEPKRRPQHEREGDGELSV